MSNIKYKGQGAKLTQIMIFRQIWSLSVKKSVISGTFLRDLEGKDMWVNCFAHVLAKGQNKYPYFRYYAKNIALISPKEHHLLDNGTEDQRIAYAKEIEKKTNGRCKVDWQKLYDLRDELEKEYKKHFPATFMGIINYKYSPEEVLEKVGKLNAKYFESLRKKM